MPKEIVEEKIAPVAVATGELYLVSALVQNEDALKELGNFLTSAGATVKKTESLGVKNLSVKINKHAALTLVSAFFTAEPAVAKALQDSLKREEYLERFLLTHWRGPIDQPKRFHRTRPDETKKSEVKS